jgi:hypothetical protein
VSAFNVFLLGNQNSNFTFDMTNGDVEGRVATNGGSFRAISFGIGSRITPCNASLPSVIVGGNNVTIDFQGGIQCGTLVAEKSADLIYLPGFANGELVVGNVQNLTGVNFTAEAQQLNATANALCAASGIPATVSEWGAISFQGTNSATQAFTVNVSDINAATSATFNFPNASLVESVVVTIIGNESLTFSNFAINNGTRTFLLSLPVCIPPNSRPIAHIPPHRRRAERLHHVCGVLVGSGVRPRVRTGGQPAGLQLVDHPRERPDRR